MPAKVRKAAKKRPTRKAKPAARKEPSIMPAMRNCYGPGHPGYWRN